MGSYIFSFFTYFFLFLIFIAQNSFITEKQQRNFSRNLEKQCKNKICIKVKSLNERRICRERIFNILK